MNTLNLHDHREQAFELRLSWFTRLLCRLFPVGFWPSIQGDPRTYISTEIVVRADWLDRLRFLVLGRARIRLRTYTDVQVHHAESVSFFTVER